MNKHIALVKRWLAGKDVTTEELRANSIAADAADARADARADVVWAAARAAHAAAHATRADARADARAYAGDARAYAGDAAHWVKRYEELINEKAETI